MKDVIFVHEGHLFVLLGYFFEQYSSDSREVPGSCGFRIICIVGLLHHRGKSDSQKFWDEKGSITGIKQLEFSSVRKQYDCQSGSKTECFGPQPFRLSIENGMERIVASFCPVTVELSIISTDENFRITQDTNEFRWGFDHSPVAAVFSANTICWRETRAYMIAMLLLCLLLFD